MLKPWSGVLFQLTASADGVCLPTPQRWLQLEPGVVQAVPAPKRLRPYTLPRLHAKFNLNFVAELCLLFVPSAATFPPTAICRALFHPFHLNFAAPTGTAREAAIPRDMMSRQVCLLPRLNPFLHLRCILTMFNDTSCLRWVTVSLRWGPRFYLDGQSVTDPF